VRDLVQRISNNGVERAADIGCGPGNSTEVLRERYPETRIVGVDSSPDMIDAARKRLPDVAFEVADIAGWAETGFDVILANAVIQWIPGHETLLPALMGKLAPGGSLAVQTPDNLDEPSHRLMREVAAHGPWAGKLADAGQRASRAQKRRLVFPPLASACAPRRHLAHDLFSSAGWGARDRRMGEGDGPPSVPRPARRARTRGLSRAL